MTADQQNMRCAYYHIVENPTLKALGYDYVNQLAGLLRLPEGASPSQTWLDEQQQIINMVEVIHPPLVRRRFRTKLLCRFMPRIAGAMYPSLACPAHKTLDPKVLAECAQLLRDEVGWWMDDYRAHLKRFDSASEQPLAVIPAVELVRDACASLGGVAGLWLTNSDWDKSYGAGSFYPSSCTDPRKKFEHVSSNCHACILAVVGGHRTIIIFLRASLRARRGKRALLCLVDSFIQRWPLAESNQIRRDSDELAQVLMGARTWI